MKKRLYLQLEQLKKNNKFNTQIWYWLESTNLSMPTYSNGDENQIMLILKEHEQYYAQNFQKLNRKWDNQQHV